MLDKPTSYDTASVNVPVRIPAVRVSLMVPPVPEANLHTKLVSEAQTEASHAVLPTLAAAV
jgi:hypothetical protein